MVHKTNEIALKDKLLEHLIEQQRVSIDYISNLFDNNVIKIRSVVIEFENKGLARVTRIEDKLGIHSISYEDRAIKFFNDGDFKKEKELEEKIRSEQKEIRIDRKLAITNKSNYLRT